MNQPLAIFLMGPTASGKTAVAVELVQRLPLEIISVDSALVYRGMDIGTAKPDAATLALAPHRLIDIRDPGEAYSAAQFRADALRELELICASGNMPLLVGGTMLYFRALEQGLSDLPGADPEVRAQLEARAAEIGWTAMHQRLAEVDAQSAARIHPNDPQRIQRALEVYELTGVALSELCRRGSETPPSYRFLKIVLAPPERATLHRRIEARFRAMLEQGFVDEVQRLQRPRHHDSQLPAQRASAYRPPRINLRCELSADEWVERAVLATRQYARRQLTWLRAEADAHWVDPLGTDAVARIAALIKQAGAAAT